MKQIGHEIIRLDEVESTNTLVMDTESYLERHGLVVTARRQTQGRGRVGKKWISLPGDQLHCSVVLHPKIPREETPILSLMAGVAVAEALEGRLGLQPRLKWPNDVLLEDKKVCGILVEMKAKPSGTLRVVVGIGLNCNGGEKGFPPDLQGKLTTLQLSTRKTVEPEQVLMEILERLEHWLEKLHRGEKTDLLDAWQAKARLGGRALRYPTPSGVREGVALGLTAEGYLEIETAEGDRHIHISGEVEWKTGYGTPF